MQALDPLTATCTTASDRVYPLVGVPGLCPAGRWALDEWMRVNRLGQLRDVTLEVLLAIQDGQATARRVH
jgi:hypothetical protein